MATCAVARFCYVMMSLNGLPLGFLASDLSALGLSHGIKWPLLLSMDIYEDKASSMTQDGDRHSSNTRRCLET